MHVRARTDVWDDGGVRGGGGGGGGGGGVVLCLLRSPYYLLLLSGLFHTELPLDPMSHDPRYFVHVRVRTNVKSRYDIRVYYSYGCCCCWLSVLSLRGFMHLPALYWGTRPLPLQQYCTLYPCYE